MPAVFLFAGKITKKSAVYVSLLIQSFIIRQTVNTVTNDRLASGCWLSVGEVSYKATASPKTCFCFDHQQIASKTPACLLMLTNYILAIAKLEKGSRKQQNWKTFTIKVKVIVANTF